jgi:hypothetical protein
LFSRLINTRVAPEKSIGCGRFTDSPTTFAAAQSQSAFFDAVGFSNATARGMPGRDMDASDFCREGSGGNEKDEETEKVREEVDVENLTELDHDLVVDGELSDEVECFRVRSPFIYAGLGRWM